jgi:hypothetical protein
MLGWAVDMINILKSIDANKADGQLGLMIYNYARLVKLLVDFEPIETGTLDEFDLGINYEEYDYEPIVSTINDYTTFT